MAKAIMVQGTSSNVGKSVIAAGLCRIFRQDGYRVVPFKSQNMALNSYITPDGLEMGRAQAMQAEAAGVECDVRMNPILLKPTSDKGSQVIVNGEVVDNMTAREYYAVKDRFVADIMKAFDSLSEENDIIVIEGAGSPAEINLNHNDFVNMGMARLAKAPVLLVGDIDRGGVFASIYGTVELVDKDKSLIKGTVINKFRGDKTILDPGLDILENLTGIPVVGVVPYSDLKLDDEDGLSERFYRKSTGGAVDIAIIRLPRISNFTDFNPLEYIDGVDIRYVRDAHEIGEPDLIIIPGTKNTMDDLKWMRESGLEGAIKKHAAKGKPVIGVCGGYQMLGRTISDPQGVEAGGEMKGIGLLNIDTVFAGQKTRCRASGTLSEVDGIFSGLSGAHYDGYEIHMGLSGMEENIINNGNVYGTYIHGIFDSDETTKAVVSALMEQKGIDTASVSAMDMKAFKEEQYDILAKTLRESLDMDLVYRILNEGVAL